jgi:protein gp37
VFDVIEAVDLHVYQVLTKRNSLMLDYVGRRYGGAPAPAHIWLGSPWRIGRTLAGSHICAGSTLPAALSPLRRRSRQSAASISAA